MSEASLPTIKGTGRAVRAEAVLENNSLFIFVNYHIHTYYRFKNYYGVLGLLLLGLNSFTDVSEIGFYGYTTHII